MSHIVVFGGVGASGRHIAASLQEAGHRVTIVDPEVAKIAQQGGITVTYADGASKKVEFSDEQLLTPDEAYGKNLGCDLAICATKSFNLNPELANDIMACTKVGAPVLLLSNGVMPYALPGNVALEIIKDTHFFMNMLSSENRPCVGGVINYPAVKTNDGVKLGAPLERIKESGVTLEKNAAALSDVFKGGDIGCIVKERAAEMVFNKLGDMLSVGPQALFSTTFADAANTQTLTGQITEAMLREHHAIAKAIGVELGERDDFVRNMQSVMQKKGGAKGSMHPDMESRKPTEKDAVYGALAELADRYHVDVSVIRKVHELIGAAEQDPSLRKILQQSVHSLEAFKAFMPPLPVRAAAKG